MRAISSHSPKARVETLEGRTLLSAWGTLDNFQLAAGQSAYAKAMATDSAGNVYAAGFAYDSTGHEHGIIREKAAGGTNWTTIEDYTVPSTSAKGGASFRAIALDSAGDIYVAGSTAPGSTNGWVVLERRAGSTAFSVVDSISGGDSGTLAIDPAGNVFVGGSTWTTNVKSGKTTYYWTVRKQTAGQGAFSTVDNAISAANQPAPYSAISVASGASAGLYFVGLGASSNWLVRKSTNAGATWTTVDNFLYPSGTNSRALGVTSDGSGNVYVVGWGFDSRPVQHWLVRKSANGGSSWSTVDDFVGSGSPPNIAEAVGTDLVGNVYAVGVGADSSGTYHDLVRSNSSGSWTTVNDLPGGGTFDAFTVGPSGGLYAAGALYDSTKVDHWVVQSAAGPTASSLAFSAQPASGTAGAPASPAFAVKIKTSGGAVVVGDTSTVTLSILSGPTGGKLSGTFTAKVSKGVATFSKLLLTKAGTYRLKATDGKLAIATSAAFKVIAARPAKLAFIQQPPAGKIGKALTPVVTVAVQDAYGNVVATDHSTIVFSIDAGPTGSILSGVFSQAAISGIASFSNLRLNKAGSYKLKATDGTDSAAISTAFKIS